MTIIRSKQAEQDEINAFRGILRLTDRLHLAQGQKALDRLSAIRAIILTRLQTIKNESEGSKRVGMTSGIATVRKLPQEASQTPKTGNGGADAD